MLGRPASRARLLLVLVGWMGISVALVGRLAFWQVLQRDRLAVLAEQQTMVRLEQTSHRGTIYDRSGTIVLASTVDRSRLAAAPAQLTAERRAAVAGVVISILGLQDAAAAMLTKAMTPDKAYVMLAHGLDSHTAA